MSRHRQEINISSRAVVRRKYGVCYAIRTYEHGSIQHLHRNLLLFVDVCIDSVLSELDTPNTCGEAASSAHVSPINASLAAFVVYTFVTRRRRRNVSFKYEYLPRVSVRPNHMHAITDTHTQR